jgi:hypothetical protein
MGGVYRYRSRGAARRSACPRRYAPYIPENIYIFTRNQSNLTHVFRSRQSGPDHTRSYPTWVLGNDDRTHTRSGMLPFPPGRFFSSYPTLFSAQSFVLLGGSLDLNSHRQYGYFLTPPVCENVFPSEVKGRILKVQRNPVTSLVGYTRRASNSLDQDFIILRGKFRVHLHSSTQYHFVSCGASRVS